MLRRLAAKRGKAELTELFALVRAHDDRALFAALAPPRPAKPRVANDKLLHDIAILFKPVVARAAEKGELLMEHLGHEGAPRGLADAVKKLRAANLSDAQIRAGAKSLIAELSRQFKGRETVV